MDKNIMTQDEKLQRIAEDIKTLYNHGFVQSRMVLVEAYHSIGELIIGLPSKYSAVNDLSRLTGINERTLYSCVQFYEKYPDINTLPEGNNISWNKIVTKYLPQKTESQKEIACDHRWLCTLCGLKK